MRPSVERVREIREGRGCGLLEARRAATQELMRNAVFKAETVDDLRDVLIELIERTP
jgi:hypothetical protein